jgi:hypothetical protein
MNSLKITLLISFCLYLTHTKAQTFEWAKSGNTISSNRIVIDRTGSLYTADWQSVAKYDSIGNFIWQQNIGGNSYDIIIAGIATDDSNNVYLAGAFGHTISIGPYTLTSDAGGNANTFLVKYNSAGIIQWITRSHSNGDSGTDGITVDKQGNILIIGRFLDSLRLDSFVFDAPMTNQIFLAKYSPAGVCLWAKHLKSETFAGGGPCPKIKSDGLGNSYICGHFNGYALFDSLQIFAHGGQYDQDIFLSKIDPSGNFLWLKALGGNNEEIIYGPMDVDSVGNTYISSYFSSAPAYFDSYTLTTNSYNYFTAKYDVNGNCKWAKYGAAGVICAVNDGFYATTPAFISKYDSLCNLQWTKTVAGASNNAMVAVNTDVYLTGSYTGSVSFDTCALSSTSNQMYIAKLSNPAPPIITNLKERENSTVFSVFPNPASRIITINLTTVKVKESYTLKVSDSLGKNVYSEAMKEITSSFTKQIDLSQLPKGIYFVGLQSTSVDSSQKKAEVKKIVLQ